MWGRRVVWLSRTKSSGVVVLGGGEELVWAHDAASMGLDQHGHHGNKHSVSQMLRVGMLRAGGHQRQGSCMCKPRV